MRAVAGPGTIFDRMGLAAGMKVLDVGAGPGRLAVLGEIPNKHEALAEIYQALKPGGIFSITETRAKDEP